MKSACVQNSTHKAMIFVAACVSLMAATPGFAAGNLPFFVDDLFAGSGSCAICHAPLQDEVGNDVSIDKSWRSTMMANSARDPYFLAKVSSEIVRFPALQEVIEDKCSTCHTPMARTRAANRGESTAMFGDGFLNDAHALHKMAVDGVSCTLCHQIQDVQLGQKPSFSGNYSIDLTTESPDRPIYGPFADPFAQNMRTITGYTPVQSDHISESRLCATCHTLYTPTVNDAGEVVGEFPEQTAFLEWGHSDYSRADGTGSTCQMCHMPPASGGVVISTIPNMLSPQSPFSRHHFVGGNAFMMTIFERYHDELDTTAGSEHFGATLDRTMDRLQNKTAELSIQDLRFADGVLDFDVSIASTAGHKLPTGFPSRRVWIHVSVLDAAGSVLFESGRIGNDGRIAGNDADDEFARYEPHYRQITQADQVQIYEAVMEDTTGNVTYTLLSANGYIKDNRLLPRGFDKATAVADIAVAGAAANDDDFDGGTDTVRYTLAIGTHAGPVNIRVNLLYQSIAYPFMADLEKDDTPEIARMSGYYHEAESHAVLLRTVERDGITDGTGVHAWRMH